MKIEERVLNLSKEGFVQCYKWIEERPTYKGVVLIVHGLAEHAFRYDTFARKLVEEEFIVYAHNQRGHKGSILTKADYGYVRDNDSFSQLLSDIYEIIEIIHQEHPNLPVFLFGHSMGSFIVQRFAQLYGSKLSGIILSGSAKNPKALLNLGLSIANTLIIFRGKKHRSRLINLMTFDAYNKVFKPNRTKFDWLNRDEKEVDKYVNDEYCGEKVTVSFYRDFFKCLLKIENNYELISKELPIIIISGSEDPVGGMSKDVTKLYHKYQSLKINDLTFKLYPQARHEIMLELCKDEVMNDCINWLNKHVIKK